MYTDPIFDLELDQTVPSVTSADFDLHLHSLHHTEELTFHPCDAQRGMDIGSRPGHKSSKPLTTMPSTSSCSSSSPQSSIAVFNLSPQTSDLHLSPHSGDQFDLDSDLCIGDLDGAFRDSLEKLACQQKDALNYR